MELLYLLGLSFSGQESRVRITFEDLSSFGSMENFLFDALVVF